MRYKTRREEIIQKIKRLGTHKITLFLLIILLSQVYEVQNTCSSNFTTDYTNPFFDAFTLYHYKEKDEAKKMLLKLARDPRYKNQAYINYGLMNQWDKNFSEAAVGYNNALQGDYPLALFYLLPMLITHQPEKFPQTLNSLLNVREKYWIEYEKAAHFASKGQEEKALVHLEHAVQEGFFSEHLLKSDPAFKSLIKEDRCRKLFPRMRKNARQKSLRKTLEEEIASALENKPYGLSKELQSLLYLKPSEMKKKEAALLTLLQSSQTFRDRSISLYWMARIKAQRGQNALAEKYLKEFLAHMEQNVKDKTGHQKMVKSYLDDLLSNDPYLKRVYKQDR